MPNSRRMGWATLRPPDVHEGLEDPFSLVPVSGDLGELAKLGGSPGILGIELEDHLQVFDLCPEFLTTQVLSVVRSVETQPLLDPGEGLVRFFEGRGHAGQLSLPGSGKFEGSLVGQVVGEVRIGMLNHGPDLNFGGLSLDVLQVFFEVLLGGFESKDPRVARVERHDVVD